MSLFGAYGSEYRRAIFFQRLLNPTRNDAYAAAVGGEFDNIGAIECDLLWREGLAEDGFVVDVGCGAGRLAVRLKDKLELGYLGLDVSSDLLDYARVSTGRSDWVFALVSKTEIPLESGRASMCAAFSVFTHLKEEDCRIYLAEMRRVLRPGGTALFSFLDPAVERHRKLLASGPMRLILTRTVFARNVGYSQDRVRRWADDAGFLVRRIDSPSRLGQSLAVFERKD